MAWAVVIEHCCNKYWPNCPDVFHAFAVGGSR